MNCVHLDTINYFFVLGIYVNGFCVVLFPLQIWFDQTKENYRGAKNALNPDINQHSLSELYCLKTRFFNKWMLNISIHSLLIVILVLWGKFSQVPPAPPLPHSTPLQMRSWQQQFVMISQGYVCILLDVNLVNETFTQFEIGLGYQLAKILKKKSSYFQSHVECHMAHIVHRAWYMVHMAHCMWQSKWTNIQIIWRVALSI